MLSSTPSPTIPAAESVNLHLALAGCQVKFCMKQGHLVIEALPAGCTCTSAKLCIRAAWQAQPNGIALILNATCHSKQQAFIFENFRLAVITVGARASELDLIPICLASFAARIALT